MVKLTNVTALEMVLAMEQVQTNTELFDKIMVMKTQFEKKSKSATGEKKLTKTQQENEKLKNVIMGTLGLGEENAIQIKDILIHERIAQYELSSQKVSALVRQLVKDGIVCRVEEKKVAKFHLGTLIKEEIVYTEPVDNQE